LELSKEPYTLRRNGSI